MDKPGQHIKSRNITLPTKVHRVKTIVFPVVICGCELDHKRRLSAEELILSDWRCLILEKILASPLAQKSNQTILEEIHPKYT